VTLPLDAAVPSQWNEEGAVQGLLESQRPRLLALFARYRIPPEDSEDLLQQALLALVYQQERIRTPGAWLVGTVRNCCRNYWTARRRQVYDAVDASVLDALAVEEGPNQEHHDLRHDLALLMEALPPRPRKLIRLCYLLGYEPAEAAAALGYSPSSVSKTTRRAFAQIAGRVLAGRASGAHAEEQVHGEQREEQVGAPNGHQRR
jgi:RNA polymerase sigma-70 factor (ECF subfamily)